MATAALKLRGLVAPVFTPMHADGSLNLDRVEAQAEHLGRQGVVGVFVAGTTGEGLSLSAPERQQLTERWCAVAAGRFPVIAHVGHLSLPDAKELAAHAQRAGATAIAAVPPFYYKTRQPYAVRDVVSCCEQVAAAAPRLPFYYYHIPGNTGVALDVTYWMDQAKRHLPTLAGLKFSDPDLAVFGDTVHSYGDDYDVYFGVDELLLPALAVGAKAAIGSTYNFAAPLYHRMIDAFQSGDMNAARRINRRVDALASSIRTLGGLPALKATMALMGVDCGPCRPPLSGLSDNELEHLLMCIEDLLPVTPPEGSPAP